jgi:hypothetical protein
VKIVKLYLHQESGILNCVNDVKLIQMPIFQCYRLEGLQIKHFSKQAKMKNFIVAIVILMPNIIFWANAANPGNNFSDINGIKFNTVQCV